MIFVARAGLNRGVFRQFWRMPMKKGCINVTGKSVA